MSDFDIVQGDGVHRQKSIITAWKVKRKRSPEDRMRSPTGWYTFLAGQWCWVFKRKGMYYATIAGKGDTPRCRTLEEVEDCVRKNKYSKIW